MSNKAGDKTDLQFADYPHVLIVDDDARIRDLLYRYLSSQSFIVVEAEDADEADTLLNEYSVDALVVDRMMPGRTGTEFVEGLREQGNNTPVLFLTAMGESDDRIAGFESGGDDYLVKPFEAKELLLRLQSLIRRSGQGKEKKNAPIAIGDYIYDMEAEVLSIESKNITLTEADVTLLNALAKRKNKTVNRIELADLCGIDPDGRNIDVQVTRLRRKIEADTKNPRYLKTVRGVGYVLRARDISDV